MVHVPSRSGGSQATATSPVVAAVAAVVPLLSASVGPAVVPVMTVSWVVESSAPEVAVVLVGDGVLVGSDVAGPDEPEAEEPEVELGPETAVSSLQAQIRSDARSRRVRIV